MYVKSRPSLAPQTRRSQMYIITVRHCTIPDHSRFSIDHGSFQYLTTDQNFRLSQIYALIARFLQLSESHMSISVSSRNNTEAMLLPALATLSQIHSISENPIHVLSAQGLSSTPLSVVAYLRIERVT